MELLPALTNYLTSYETQYHIKTQFRVSGDEQILFPRTKIFLFRIVQECLTNIHRHSGSKSATVRLTRTPEGVALDIEDQGKGIPIEKLHGIHAHRSGVGITRIRERVRHFNGAIEIHSNGTGTKISVTLPVSATDSAEPEVVRVAPIARPTDTVT